MGNNQGKQITKIDILQKLSNTQKGYIESWYLALSNEDSNSVSKRVFFEDVLKRFANMPIFIIDSLFECMDPDSKNCVTEDSFYYMAYIIINGNHEEKCQLVYSMLQRIGRTPEVTVSSSRVLYQNQEKTWNGVSRNFSNAWELIPRHLVMNMSPGIVFSISALNIRIVRSSIG